MYGWTLMIAVVFLSWFVHHRFSWQGNDYDLDFQMLPILYSNCLHSILTDMHNKSQIYSCVLPNNITVSILDTLGIRALIVNITQLNIDNYNQIITKKKPIAKHNNSYNYHTNTYLIKYTNGLQNCDKLWQEYTNLRRFSNNLILHNINNTQYHKNINIPRIHPNIPYYYYYYGMLY